MDRPLYIAGRRGAKQPIGWGTPMPLLHESIAEIHEKPFIEKLLKDLHYRENVFNLKDLSIRNADAHTGVALRDFAKKLTSDIDILVVPRGRPEASTAIEVKRFKVGLNAVRTGRPSGLHEFRKGVRQANALARIGFSQVYLWIFVLVDTREQNTGRLTYEGPDAKLRSRIENAFFLSELNSRVGLVSFQWVQPMDRPPLELGTYGGRLRQSPRQEAQPPELTEWLSTLAV